MKKCLAALMALIAAGAVSVSAADPKEVRAFVRQGYIHGVPYNEAAKLGPDSVPTLVAILQDPVEEPYWANAVAVLGNVGGAAAVDPLLSFFAGGQGTLSHAQYKAKSGTLMALGYVVHRTKDPKALDYLIKGLNEKTWKERALPWKAAHFKTEAELHQQLVKLSLIGLGLSGEESAGLALQEFRERQAPGSLYLHTVEQALETHGRVAEIGLSGYYK